VVAPTVVTAASLAGIVAAANGMNHTQGFTNTGIGIDAITAAMLGSSNYTAGLNSIINIATDGQPTNVAAAIAAATASARAGIDALTAEGIGSVDFEPLRDIVFSPLLPGGLPCDDCGVQLAAGAIPTNPMTSLPWILPVNSFNEFPVAISNKVQAVIGNTVPEPSALALVAVALLAGSLACKRPGRSAA
jgi:hypothetical protein